MENKNDDIPKETEDLENEEPEETEEEVEDPETATDDEEDTGDDEDEDDELEEGKGANARIRKLVQEKKELQDKLKEAQTLAGDDGKAILRAAEVTGILPGLMSKEEAGAFTQMDQLPGVIKAYKRWARVHDKGDEYETGKGESMTYAEVLERIDELEEIQEKLKGKFGQRRAELEAEVKEIYTLGLKAKKQGWKPDGGTPKGKKPKPGDAPNRSRTKPPANAERTEDVEVEEPDDLDQYLIAARRRKKKK